MRRLEAAGSNGLDARLIVPARALAELGRAFRGESGKVELYLAPVVCQEVLAEVADSLRPLAEQKGLRFTLEGTPLELTVYWIDVYGGGLFLPFRDATCPGESYGGGRYLFDTVKGSDFLRVDNAEAGASFGYAGGRVIIDFNYAYNPSCAYDARWVCPLAPKENRLAVAIRAGERKFHD